MVSVATAAVKRGLRGAGVLGLVAVVVVAGGGCGSWGRGKDFEPLSAEEFDDLYLKNALGVLIHQVLAEAEPEALRRFFPPDARQAVDYGAFYRQLVGAPPGVYQPRFWDMKLLKIEYSRGRTQARTRLTLEYADLRPRAGGAGRSLPLRLTWTKQAEHWYLKPPPAAAPTEAGPPPGPSPPPPPSPAP